ncbi:MAG: hypothetical protein KDI33_04800 [Halioglobus sp.]|nr:hypothetical protein [Halioglobus sp.]
MRRAYKEKEEGPVTEMAIVNTFTKLIFGDEGYTPRELAIIDAFQSMDNTIVRDSHTEMGEYLRNLGVREMIQLVSGLRQHLGERSNTPPPALHKKRPLSPRID